MITLLLFLLTAEVRVKISPLISISPATILAQVIIQEHKDNRYLVMILSDETGEVSRSEQTIDTDIIINRKYTLNPGSYIFEAILIRGNKQFRDSQKFEVR